MASGQNRIQLSIGNIGLSRLQKLADRFKSFSPHTITMLLWSSLGMVCVALFLRLAFSVQTGGALQSIDEKILLFIGSSLRSSSWDFMVIDVSSLGSLAVVSTFCVISVILFTLMRDPAAAIHLVGTVIGAFYLSGWAKTWIDRPRPNIIPKLIQTGGMSFPSGHAVTAATIYMTLAILCCRHLTTHTARVTIFFMAAILISAVCFSRVYLGVHYPSDVFSGALLGSAWALFVGALFSKQHHLLTKKS